MKQANKLKRQLGLNEEASLKHIRNKHKKKGHPIILAFNVFSKKASDIVGSAWTFISALCVVIIWAIVGQFFHYSDTWQLVINTGTTIVTFLVVFLIQNTQNRDTEILNLKIDELIVSKKDARNHVIDLASLSDVELKELEKEYLKLCNKKTGQ